MGNRLGLDIPLCRIGFGEVACRRERGSSYQEFQLGVFPVAVLRGLPALHSRASQLGNWTHRQRGHVRVRFMGGEPGPAKIFSRNISCFVSCRMCNVCVASNCGAIRGKILLNPSRSSRIASILLLSFCSCRVTLWAQQPTLPDSHGANTSS